jgi:DNA-binding IclR family transcriptional regulator
VASRYALDPAMRNAAATISRRTGENVVIAHRNDIRLQYLHFENADKHALVAKVGTTRLLCHSGVGWALLGFMSNRAIQSTVRRTNAVLTSEDAVELASVLHVVEACRRTGHIRAEHTIRIGFGVIAMPLRFGRSELAIGVSAATVRIRDDEAEIVEIMRSTLAGVPGCSGIQ